ncbi:DUF962 domain-containing protein [Phenylobacterium immobile]|uniref:Mpo1 family 2-hydroxy fatty acid dioxygenase n=1 Tax=Phenylobacterium immobile TaxID=21 RepID=UPI000A7B4B64|nr:Mpo1-like protein [Phenylobacterium immobile]
MTELVRQLAAYAAYHRDRRNVATHMVGIPVIVLAMQVLTSRPMLDAGGWTVTTAVALSAAAALYYLRLDLGFGAAMAALMTLGCGLGAMIASMPTAAWLAIGAGGFIGGWALQFIGHHYEGRKPAFFDNLLGLLIGPLFIVADIAFALGLRRAVRTAVHHDPSAT